MNGRWVEKPGLPRGRRSRDSAYSSWQTGWCGGLATTLPLLAAGSKTVARARARDHRVRARRRPGAVGLLPRRSPTARPGSTTVSSAPLPPARVAADARPRPRAVVYKHARRWHLVRRSAETLTFLVKQIALLERQPASCAPARRASAGRRRRAARRTRWCSCGSATSSWASSSTSRAASWSSADRRRPGWRPPGWRWRRRSSRSRATSQTAQGDRRALLRSLRARRV